MDLIRNWQNSVKIDKKIATGCFVIENIGKTDGECISLCKIDAWIVNKFECVKYLGICRH